MSEPNDRSVVPWVSRLRSSIIPDSKKNNNNNKDMDPELRGGQTKNDSFLEGVQSALCNLAHHPIALCYTAICFFVISAEHEKRTGPLESIEHFLTLYVTKEQSTLFLFLANGSLWVVALAISYKGKILAVSLFWVTPLAKPQTRYLVMTVVASVLTLAMPQTSLFLSFMYSVLFYLFSVMRNPGHKILIFALLCTLVYNNVPTASTRSYTTALRHQVLDLKPLEGVEDYETLRLKTVQLNDLYAQVNEAARQAMSNTNTDSELHKQMGERYSQMLETLNGYMASANERLKKYTDEAVERAKKDIGGAFTTIMADGRRQHIPKRGTANDGSTTPLPIKPTDSL